MSDGVSAMFDRIAEEQHKRNMEKFMERSDNAKLQSVMTAIDKLNLFVSMDPSLTRNQWSLIDCAISELQDLIK